MPLGLVGSFPFSELCSWEEETGKWGKGHPSLQHAKPRLKRFLSSKASRVSAVGINSKASRETQGRPHLSRIHEAFSVSCCRSNSSSRCLLDHREETTTTRQHSTPTNCVGTYTLSLLPPGQRVMWAFDFTGGESKRSRGVFMVTPYSDEALVCLQDSPQNGIAYRDRGRAKPTLGPHHVMQVSQAGGLCTAGWIKDLQAVVLS